MEQEESLIKKNLRRRKERKRVKVIDGKDGQRVKIERRIAWKERSRKSMPD